jgi:hypothetical protein
MAATDLRQSRFGSSMSGAQPGTEPSLADTLPAVDFNFNDLRERMAQFTLRFDEFIERGRKRVLEERNAFRMSLADVEGKSRATKRIALRMNQELTVPSCRTKAPTKPGHLAISVKDVKSCTCDR